MLGILGKGWKERQKVLFVVCDVFWAGWERVFFFFLLFGVAFVMAPAEVGKNTFKH